MNTKYIKSVQDWLVDIGLLSTSSYEWTPESLNALSGAVMRDNAVDPTNLTVLRTAPVGYRFVDGLLVKYEEELVGTPTVSSRPVVARTEAPAQAKHKKRKK